MSIGTGLSNDCTVGSLTCHGIVSCPIYSEDYNGLYRVIERPKDFGGVSGSANLV
jgi:hypothetical protein